MFCTQCHRCKFLYVDSSKMWHHYLPRNCSKYSSDDTKQILSDTFLNKDGSLALPDFSNSLYDGYLTSVYSLCTCYFILFYLIFVCYCFLYPFIRSSFCWACHVRWYLKRKGYGRRLVWNLKSRWLTYFELSCSHVICAAEISSDSKNWMSLLYGNFCTLNLTVLLILFFYCLIWLNSAWRLSQSLEEI